MMRAAVWLLAAAACAQTVPDWVREQKARPVPQYPAKVSSVVLLAEEQLTVAPDGRRTMRERGVIRVLQRSRDNIAAWRSYNTKTGRIRDFHAWLLPADGAERAFKPEEVLDVALSQGFTYDEGRAKTVECPANQAPGTVFAYEVTEEEKTVFTQYVYDFQGRMPALTSRFVLMLPPGWEQRTTTWNHAPVEPAVRDGQYVWELKDLPWIEPEENTPGLGSIVPRLGITCYPPRDNASGLRVLNTWNAVGEWLSSLVEPSTESTAPVAAKSAQLTTGAATNWDKLRSVAAFAQQVNYVSVQMNLTRGGGYVPHTASQVLTRNYGDCKDKASLMKSLLRSAGIEAYVAIVYSGNRYHVRPEWPSTLQFNHAIVAVKAGADMNAPAIAEYPKLGRLLFFDPTDPHTPLGDLPQEEQGSQMLVLAGGSGELVTAPVPPASETLVESDVEATLGVDGKLAAKLERQYRGQQAAAMRASLKQEGPREFRRTFEGSFAARMGGVTFASIEPVDKAAERRFEVKVAFDVPQFAKPQAKLLLLRPGNIVPGTRYAFPTKERKWPVRLRASMRQDKIAIALPAGYKVDEIPDPEKIETPYGMYRAGYKEAGGFLVMEQTLEVKDGIFPAAEYGRIREFFERVSGYQNATIVLAR